MGAYDCILLQRTPAHHTELSGLQDEAVGQWDYTASRAPAKKGKGALRWPPYRLQDTRLHRHGERGVSTV